MLFDARHLDHHRAELAVAELLALQVGDVLSEVGSAGEFVPGFLDGLAQRAVGRQRLAGDLDGACGDVDVDSGDPRKLADLGPDGAGTVVAAHPADHDGTSRHVRHRRA